MEWNKIMNVVILPVGVILLVVSMPLYLLYKFISFVTGRLYKEDLTGKVVLITGASSGIGEYLAYEYAKRGARLALVARREERLQAVASKACSVGSSDVIVITADVSKVQDCKRFVDETINHFGRLDHLVNNAGIASLDSIGNPECRVSELVPTMDINFWGSVYGTHFAIPHLRKSKGKIVVMSSIASVGPSSLSTIYNASKAALYSLFEALRLQLGSDIGITIVTPGFVESEMTVDQGFNIAKYGMIFIKLEPVEDCVKAIVDSVCRGDAYLTEPSWYRLFFLIFTFCPEVFRLLNKMVVIPN
ncbi:hypothetical protein ACFE04_027341 [Oxalis oulophora]